MIRKSIIQGITAALTCILAVFVMQIYVFAQEYPLTINDESESFYIEPGSYIYDFLINLDIDNLAVLHSDGTSVSTELFDKIVQKKANKDFIGIVKLVAMYELSLQVEEVSRSRGIPGEVFTFTSMRSHRMTSQLGNVVYVTTNTRTSITRNPDGTVSPNEPRPSVTVSNAFIGTGWFVNLGVTDLGNRRIENNRAVEAFADIHVSAIQSFQSVDTHHNFGIIRLRYRIV